MKSWLSVGCRVSDLMFYRALSIKIFGIYLSVVTVPVSAACVGCIEATVRHHLAQMLAELAAFEPGCQGKAIHVQQAVGNRF